MRLKIFLTPLRRLLQTYAPLNPCAVAPHFHPQHGRSVSAATRLRGWRPIIVAVASADASCCSGRRVNARSAVHFWMSPIIKRAQAQEINILVIPFGIFAPSDFSLKPTAINKCSWQRESLVDSEPGVRDDVGCERRRTLGVIGCVAVPIPAEIRPTPYQYVHAQVEDNEERRNERKLTRCDE